MFCTLPEHFLVCFGKFALVNQEHCWNARCLFEECVSKYQRGDIEITKLESGVIRKEIVGGYYLHIHR